MKKILKITSKISLALVVLYGVFIGATYFYIKNQWKTNRTEEDYNRLILEIQQTPELPEEFYKQVEKIYHYSKDKSTFSIIAALPYDLAQTSCPCSIASYGFVSSLKERLSVGMKLDKDVTPKKCFDYYFNELDFLNNSIGIFQASHNYYGKPMELLNEKEMLEIAIMSTNPAFYNKKRHPENLKEKVLEVSNKN